MICVGEWSCTGIIHFDFVLAARLAAFMCLFLRSAAAAAEGSDEAAPLAQIIAALPPRPAGVLARRLGAAQV